MRMIYLDPRQSAYFGSFFLTWIGSEYKTILKQKEKQNIYFTNNASACEQYLIFSIFYGMQKISISYFGRLSSGSMLKSTFRVLGFCRAGSCQVKMCFFIFTEQDDAAQAVCGKYSRHPAWRYRRLGLVIFTQACEHGVVVHLILFLSIFLIFFHLKHNSSPYI